MAPSGGHPLETRQKRFPQLIHRVIPSYPHRVDKPVDNRRVLWITYPQVIHTTPMSGIELYTRHRSPVYNSPHRTHDTNSLCTTYPQRPRPPVDNLSTPYPHPVENPHAQPRSPLEDDGATRPTTRATPVEHRLETRAAPLERAARSPASSTGKPGASRAQLSSRSSRCPSSDPGLPAQFVDQLDQFESDPGAT